MNDCVFFYPPSLYITIFLSSRREKKLDREQDVFRVGKEEINYSNSN
jgi:hypothetical protein